MNEVDTRTRAETVGSLLRPREVLQALAGDGGQSRDPERVREILDSAVLEAIGIQQDAGLDVITDGEMRRIAWVQTTNFLDCFEVRPGGAALNWRGGEPVDVPMDVSFPVVVRRVREADRTGDMAAEYAFLARHAATRTKYSLAAPSYHRRCWSEVHSTAAYGSCEEFLTEVRDYEREVVEAVVELGCDYVQLDAPNYGSLCDPELDNSLFEGIENVTTALHICRGNAPGGKWHSTGG